MNIKEQILVFLILFSMKNSCLGQFQNKTYCFNEKKQENNVFKNQFNNIEKKGVVNFLEQFLWNGDVGIKSSLIFSNKLHGEIGIIKTPSPAMVSAVGFFEGASLASEFNFEYNHFIIAPKIGYEFNFIFLSVKGSCIYFTDFKNSDIRILPECGLTFVSLISILYGYAIPLSGYEFDSIGKNRVTIVLNIPLGK